MKKIDEQIKHAARSSLHFKLGKIYKLLPEGKQKTQKKRMKKKKENSA